MKFDIFALFVYIFQVCFYCFESLCCCQPLKLYSPDRSFRVSVLTSKRCELGETAPGGLFFEVVQNGGGSESVSPFDWQEEFNAENDTRIWVT